MGSANMDGDGICEAYSSPDTVRQFAQNEDRSYVIQIPSKADRIPPRSYVIQIPSKADRIPPRPPTPTHTAPYTLPEERKT